MKFKKKLSSIALMVNLIVTSSKSDGLKYSLTLQNQNCDDITVIGDL